MFSSSDCGIYCFLEPLRLEASWRYDEYRTTAQGILMLPLLFYTTHHTILVFGAKVVLFKSKFLERG